MTGSKCQYFNCSKSRNLFPHLKMYRFPKDSRREIWIINSGKYFLNTTLHNMFKTPFFSLNRL
jgi:hypothetical protein